jgi:hypothetical protein
MRFVVQIDIDLTVSTGKKVVQLESLRKLEVDIQVWNSNCSSSLTEVLQTSQTIYRNKLRKESQERKTLQRQRPDPFVIGKRIPVRYFDINLFGCELSHNAKCCQDEDVAGCIENWVAGGVSSKS